MFGGKKKQEAPTEVIEEAKQEPTEQIVEDQSPPEPEQKVVALQTPVEEQIEQEPVQERPPETPKEIKETAAPVEPVQQEAPKPEKKSWFQRLKSGLSKSSSKLTEGISSVFTKSKLDDDTIQDLEDLLIQADLGVDTAMRITDTLAKTRYDKNISADEVKKVLAEEVEKVLEPVAQPLVLDYSKKPHVILTVGVNGAGKTTTIGKLAQNYVNDGKKVMMAAGDTFRAAAIEQLQIWGERTNSTVVTREQGSDSASLAHEALRQAEQEDSDILLIDTAGRLQNKANLMAELEKVVRVIKKFDETAPHTVLLVLDATTGQNAMNQVEIFAKTAGVTGLIMTKLDGTARGGILVAIANKYKLPIHAIGVGEGIDDLQPFNASEFAQAIALD
ncbi:MAG: signal recognition particle-docking protein FtsY [Methyloligellaceae bacterium]